MRRRGNYSFPLVSLVPKLCLGTQGLEALLRGDRHSEGYYVSAATLVRRSKASWPRVPKQSLGTRHRRDRSPELLDQQYRTFADEADPVTQTSQASNGPVRLEWRRGENDQVDSRPTHVIHHLADALAEDDLAANGHFCRRQFAGPALQVCRRLALQAGVERRLFLARQAGDD